jgi:excisionase family DNA binding protein
MNITARNDLLSVPEAAETLRVSEACIRSWCSRGILQRRKAGRRTLILREDLMAMVTTPTLRQFTASL